MKNLDYGIAYAEVLEVLKYVSLDDYNKIPKKYITFLEENSDENSTFTYNTAIPFKKQEISDDTKNILAMLYRLFWASEIEKAEFRKNDKLEEQKRIELNEKYSPENVFKRINEKKEAKNEQIDTVNKEISVIEYKENNWIQKLFVKIRSLFKKDKK